uniref:PPM-type phosphatase domain-containing protein n=1 Tax=Acrobeloides nanus TaxID=290746 RepID=A0A914CCN0_9BILA
MFFRRYFHYEAQRLIRTRSSTDAHLRANEKTIVLNEGAITRIDVSQLAANSPIEDYFSAAKCRPSGAHLFGVFDGHAGAACSRHVSTRLFDYCCAATLVKHIIEDVALNERLQWLFSSADTRLPSFMREQHVNNVIKFMDKFKSNTEVYNVRKSLQSAFMALDEDISNGALPDSKGQVCRMSASIAASGSCATVGHIRKNHLHVANIGDSAAILGVCHHNAMIARQLSRSHSTDNDDEVQRLRSAHPISESGSLLKGGRLLGELIPLRAFGDLRYKWPKELQKVVLEPLGVSPPVSLFTPPYLTALPEVFYHRLTPNDKFLVLATDGLWEWLDPDTVVRLIMDHSLGAETLSLYQPKSGLTLREVALELEQRADRRKVSRPIDDNSATHVIRNALGGVGETSLQYEKLHESLSLAPGMARHYRDDVTVIVVHFNEEYLTKNASGDDVIRKEVH